MDNSAFLTMSALSLLCLTMFFCFFFFKYSKVTGSLDLYS